MKKLFLSLFIATLFVFNPLLGQTQKSKYFYVANYNLENLFDITDDPQKDDAEFLPGSEKKWDQEKLDRKYINLAKMIRSMDDGQAPDILGVEEVENRGLLDTLIARHFKDINYGIAYANSPDNRGIDVGLLFNPELFSLLYTTADTVKLVDGYPTRQVLMAALKMKNGKKKSETLYVFVNHWPSRRGGEEESEKNRIAAAKVLKKRVAGLLKKDKNANIIIMGDFNDMPSNASIYDTLGAKGFTCDSLKLYKQDLFNLAYGQYKSGNGSYFYRGNWNMLDQIIVSRNLINKRYQCESFQVYKPEFAQTRSGSFKGASRPTYGGNNYLGGFSDHFPVTAKFWLN